MNKFITFLLAALFATISVTAQEYSISGKILDAKTGKPIELATIRLMKGDSSFVSGENTSANGSFSLKIKSPGKYILKLSFIGYISQTRNVTLSASSKTASVGNISLKTNDVILKQATVTTHVAKMEVKGDTFIYNAAAYRVPEGSTLEALVEKLPGAEVDDD